MATLTPELEPRASREPDAAVLRVTEVHEPELLLLDEPYSGFDWETYLHFWEMSERRRDARMGILIVSHLLTERQRLDRVCELKAGKAALQ